MESRVPPHSVEAEQWVLGSAMLSQTALDDITEIVKANDFYDEKHKEIFKAIYELARKSSPVDMLTVSEELSKRNSLEMVGGRAYVAYLSSQTITVANAAEYARIVADKASLRKLIDMADDLVGKGYDDSMESSDLIEYAEGSIFNISQSRQKGHYSHLRDILMNTIDSIEEAAESDGGLTGVTTGFKQLDEKTSGLQKSNLIILAARPAMGKTAFALTMALNAATKAKANVMIFSMEMSEDELVKRLLAMESKIDMQKLKTGQLDRRDWDDINIAMGALAQSNIVIDDTAGMTLMEMKSKCRRLKAEKGLDLIVVDYLQLMTTESSESRTQEISALSRGLKLLARELDCPVVVLSQLSRKPEERTDHRPMLSDLRESGSIEQDADIVMFLYRDDYYNEDSENPGECEVIIAKQRSGPTGTVKVTWLSKITRFADSIGTGFNGF